MTRGQQRATSPREIAASARCHAPCGEGGSILPLIAGFAVIALVLVLGATAASVAFLAQRDLANVCDGAAIAAAQSLDEASFYRGAGDDDVLPLSQTVVESAVARYLGQDYARDPNGLTMSAGTDGRVVTVRCQRAVTLPFGALVGYPNGLPRTATARAEAPVLPPQ